MANVRQWASSPTKRKGKAKIGEIRERRGGKYKKLGEGKWARVVEGRKEAAAKPAERKLDPAGEKEVRDLVANKANRDGRIRNWIKNQEETLRRPPSSIPKDELKRIAKQVEIWKEAERRISAGPKQREKGPSEAEQRLERLKEQRKHIQGGRARDRLEQSITEHEKELGKGKPKELSPEERSKAERELVEKQAHEREAFARSAEKGKKLRGERPTPTPAQGELDLGESKGWQSWKAADLKKLPEPHEGQNLEKKPWKAEPPPGMISGDFVGSPPGGRGGTEQMHWDPKTNDYTPERRAFHDQVIGSYFEGKVPAKGQKVAIVMMGGTASGKSTMLRTAGRGGPDFVHVDPDDIKGKLPEYREAVKQKYKGAASMAHEESSTLGKRVLKEAIDGGYNVVLDGTGANGEKYAKQVQGLKDKGYFVHLMMPDQDMATAVRDAGGRAERTGRYVPNEFIAKAYDAIPGNFHKIAKLADSAQLFDRRRNGKMVWEKTPDGAVQDHDPEFVSKYPGLPGFTGR